MATACWTSIVQKEPSRQADHGRSKGSLRCSHAGYPQDFNRHLWATWGPSGPPERPPREATRAAIVAVFPGAFGARSELSTAQSLGERGSNAPNNPANFSELPRTTPWARRQCAAQGARTHLPGRITAYCAHSPRRTSTLTARPFSSLESTASNSLADPICTFATDKMMSPARSPARAAGP